MTKETFKRYLVSSLVTFLAGLFSTLLFDWDKITLETLKDGSILGIIFLAVRGGFKGVLELFILTFADKKE